LIKKKQNPDSYRDKAKDNPDSYRDQFFSPAKAFAMPPKKLYFSPFRQKQPHNYQRM
jgi:hypothetical protein